MSLLQFCGHITYLPTGEGWLYLAFTLDTFSRRVVGYHCAPDLRAALTLEAFARACRRHPPGQGLIHHSDRGTPYAAAAFRDQLHAHGVTPSMSRAGNPYDNALAESFVATLKTECFAGFVPPTRQAAQLLVFDYLESFYNPRRRHRSLDYLSPCEFEQRFAQRASAQKKTNCPT